MKLEIKHLAPYLPYGLKFYYESLDGKKQYSWVLSNDKIDFALEMQNKPILRPLSDFTDINSKAIYDLNIDLTNQIELNEIACKHRNYTSCEYTTILECFKNHIDVFDLITNRLAIDINTLNQTK